MALDSLMCTTLYLFSGDFPAHKVCKYTNMYVVCAHIIHTRAYDKVLRAVRQIVRTYISHFERTFVILSGHNIFLFYALLDYSSFISKSASRLYKALVIRENSVIPLELFLLNICSTLVCLSVAV